MVSWLVWSILRVQFQKLCRQYCGNVCVGASGVSGDQLDPVSLLPPTVRLLEFLNFDIDRYSYISFLLPVVVLMSKLRNPTCYRHTATHVRSKMVNATLLLYQGSGTAIWMMDCYVIDNCFYHSPSYYNTRSRLEEVESDGGQGNREEAA